MEVLGELAAGGALRWAALPAASSAVRPASGPGLRSVPAGLQPSQALASDGGGSGDLPRILALLKRASSTAVEDTGVMGFRAAVVTRRNHQHRQRHPALQPSPPPDPQGTVENPPQKRHPLVHTPTPHRPTPTTPTKPPPQNMNPRPQAGRGRPHEERRRRRDTRGASARESHARRRRANTVRAADPRARTDSRKLPGCW